MERPSEKTPRLLGRSTAAAREARGTSRNPLGNQRDGTEGSREGEEAAWAGRDAALRTHSNWMMLVFDRVQLLLVSWGSWSSLLQDTQQKASARDPRCELLSETAATMRVPSECSGCRGTGLALVCLGGGGRGGTFGISEVARRVEACPSRSRWTCRLHTSRDLGE